MVRDHQLQGFWSEQPDAVELAAIDQRAAESEIVGHGRAQSATAGHQGRRRQERARRRIVLQRQLARALLWLEDEAALRVGRIAGRQAVSLARRHVKIRVGHAQRIENALLEELLERPAADLADEIT